MITNFHLPKSTLMLMMSSFAGKDAVVPGLPGCDRASDIASFRSATRCWYLK